uniref:Uncharacterized protein n=1 Tax=Anguilla anguilla TaxID=7936 RepID=A0A0E9RCD1_ANGAN
MLQPRTVFIARRESFF